MAGRIFEFTTEFSLPIPAEALKAASNRDASNDLPFKAWFDKNMSAASEGKAPSTFVPFAFFTASEKEGGRGIEKAKVDGAYVKGKLRDQFNGWQAKTKKVITAAVREPATNKVSEKNGKTYKVAGKLITEEVSENPLRGHFSIVMIERTGKEKDVGTKEPGVHMWMILTQEAEAARKAAAAA